MLVAYTVFLFTSTAMPRPVKPPIVTVGGVWSQPELSMPLHLRPSITDTVPSSRFAT